MLCNCQKQLQPFDITYFKWTNRICWIPTYALSASLSMVHLKKGPNVDVKVAGSVSNNAPIQVNVWSILLDRIKAFALTRIYLNLKGVLNLFHVMLAEEFALDYTRLPLTSKAMQALHGGFLFAPLQLEVADKQKILIRVRINL